MPDAVTTTRRVGLPSIQPILRADFPEDVALTGFSKGAMGGINSRLYLLLNEALAGYEGKLRNDIWLAVHPVDSPIPWGCCTWSAAAAFRKHRD
jgi:hypothetical protein